MPPTATILFVAKEDPSVAVLAAHMLALASNDRLRTGVASLHPRGPHGILRHLLAENMMPHWWLPQVNALDALPANLARPDIAVILTPDLAQTVRAVAPHACVTEWTFPAVGPARVDEMTDLFDWRCLYASIARRVSMTASLSPTALRDLKPAPLARR